MLIFTQPKGQTKGQKTFFLSKLLSQTEVKSTPMKKTQITVSLTVKYPCFFFDDFPKGLPPISFRSNLPDHQNTSYFQGEIHFHEYFWYSFTKGRNSTVKAKLKCSQKGNALFTIFYCAASIIQRLTWINDIIGKIDFSKMDEFLKMMHELWPPFHTPTPPY